MVAKVVPVYLEVAPKRMFACAVDWPGWARHGRTEDQARASLLEYTPRYALALKGSRLGFAAPVAPAQLAVVERLTGNATTEFGAPAVAQSCAAAGARRSVWHVLAHAWEIGRRASVI
ncbi:MAG: hypothetical protein IPK64_17560 [bacterium]|nr:hypothetical protein [bacterium]